VHKIPFAALLLLVAVVSAPSSSAAAEAPAVRSVTLAVEKMSCAACPITVRKALERVPGVSRVTVDYDRKTAVVTFDPARASIEALTRATTEAGYPSSLKP